MSNDLQIHAGPFRAQKRGLVIDGEPTREEWLAYGESIREVEGAIQWVTGDWIVHGFDEFEQGKWEVIEAKFPSKSKSILEKYQQVSNAFEFHNRLWNLSWTHYDVLSEVREEKRAYWAEQAVENGWSVRALRVKIAESSHIALYKGDMLEVLPALATKFDLVVTDPPYGVTDWEWDELHTLKWLEGIRPYLQDEYNIFWFCSPRFSADIELIFRKLELPIQSRIVWHRRNMAKGSKAKNKFVDSWEMILHAGNRELNFPEEWSDAWFDVQTFAVPQTNFGDRKMHPTQKPEDLIARLVEFGSYPSDKILDPFAGSGTTGLACPDDRECVLIELEEGYVGITEGRLSVKRTKWEG